MIFKLEGENVDLSTFEIDSSGRLESYNGALKPQSVIDIPKKVNRIGEYVFYERTEVEKFNIPDSVTKIENHAFYCCTKLKEIKLPSKLKYLSGFTRCSSLSNITIPEGVEEIGVEAFAECKSLTTVTLPSTIK